jgi:hypothetical protein
MKKLINQLLGTKGPDECPLVLTNYSSFKPRPITPEYINWCKELHVSSLADRRSNKVEIIMGNKVKIVDLQSIYHS